MKKHIAIIGAGTAGMETAVRLSGQGYKITLLEQAERSGGKLNQWSSLFPDKSAPTDVLNRYNRLNEEVNIMYNTRVASIERHNERFVVSDGYNMFFHADAVVLSTGFKVFDARRKEEYGYGIFDNVITSAELEERLKSPGGITTAQGKTPSRIAIIHCVGSRDAKVGNTYCSKVCCITAVKQAIELNKRMPACEVFNFYIDLRLYGSTFDNLYLEAQKKHNIQFIRGRLSEVAQKEDRALQIKAEDTLSGKPLRMTTDMVVLMVGMEPAENTPLIAQKSGIALDDNGFFKTANIQYQRNQTQMEGVFMSGSCICPMSVNETLENARSCALEVMEYLNR